MANPQPTSEAIILESEVLTKEAIDEIGALIVDEAAGHQTPKSLARKKVSEDLVKRLTFLGAPVEEIALHTNVSVTTLYRRFGKVIERARTLRNFAVRRKQFKVAVIDGDSNMLRWLGIQWLGQSNSVQVTGPGGGPLEVHTTHDYRSLSRDELFRLAGQTGERLGAIQTEIKALLAGPAEASTTTGAASAGVGEVESDSAADSHPGCAPESTPVHPGEQA